MCGAKSPQKERIVVKFSPKLTHYTMIIPAKAEDVEVESKIEQLQVVGNSSENLRTDREYKLTS